jgi:hypothetical protein
MCCVWLDSISTQGFCQSHCRSSKSKCFAHLLAREKVNNLVVQQIYNHVAHANKSLNLPSPALRGG